MADFFGQPKSSRHRAVPLRLRGGEPAADFRVMQQPVERKQITRIAAALMADLQQLAVSRIVCTIERAPSMVLLIIFSQ